MYVLSQRHCFQNYQFASNDFYYSCGTELSTAHGYNLTTELFIFQTFRNQACCKTHRICFTRNQISRSYTHNLYSVLWEEWSAIQLLFLVDHHCTLSVPHCLHPEAHLCWLSCAHRLKHNRTLAHRCPPRFQLYILALSTVATKYSEVCIHLLYSNECVYVVFCIKW